MGGLVFESYGIECEEKEDPHELWSTYIYFCNHWLSYTLSCKKLTGAYGFSHTVGTFMPTAAEVLLIYSDCFTQVFLVYIFLFLKYLNIFSVSCFFLIYILCVCSVSAQGSHPHPRQWNVVPWFCSEPWSLPPCLCRWGWAPQEHSWSRSLWVHRQMSWSTGSEERGKHVLSEKDTFTQKRLLFCNSSEHYSSCLLLKERALCHHFVCVYI